MEGTSQHTWHELAADTEETDRQAGNTQDARRRKMRKGNVTGRHPGVDRRRCGGAGVKTGGSRFSSGHRMKLKNGALRSHVNNRSILSMSHNGQNADSGDEHYDTIEHKKHTKTLKSDKEQCLH